LQKQSLQKTIGFWSATALVAGSIIGSGVFMKPASMAAQLGSPLWLTLVWIIAGLFSLGGALVFAELGAAMPRTGGVYVYFQEMYGDFFAFLYGWAAFAVINTAAVAAIAFVCAQYADYFLSLPRFDAATEHNFIWHIPLLGNLFPLQNIGVKALAIVLVAILTFLNYRSAQAGSALQVVSTVIKFAVLFALVVGIFLSGNGSLHHLVSGTVSRPDQSLIGGIAAALTGAFFAYDGWINVTFVGGEINNPQKTIPRSLLLGVLACITVYVLVNEAYLYALPIEKIATSPIVASNAISATIGLTAGGVIAALIVICTFGAINGNILATARVTYAMGKDAVFATWCGREHPRFHTPGNALLLHGIWTAGFIITGSFDMLADMFVFITWIAYLFGAIGLFVLRSRYPGTARPYRVVGYPVLPILFILFSFFYLVFTVWNDVQNYQSGKAAVINSLLGLAITALGVPLYFYFRHRKKEKMMS
jgi:basic amino acid/polyamine antiporter, APA family